MKKIIFSAALLCGTLSFGQTNQELAKEIENLKIVVNQLRNEIRELKGHNNSQVKPDVVESDEEIEKNTLKFVNAEGNLFGGNVSFTLLLSPNKQASSVVVSNATMIDEYGNELKLEGFKSEGIYNNPNEKGSKKIVLLFSYKNQEVTEAPKIAKQLKINMIYKYPNRENEVTVRNVEFENIAITWK